MYRQKIAKGLSVVLTLAVATAPLCACGNSHGSTASGTNVKVEKASNGAVSYPLKGHPTFTMAMIEETQVTANAKDLMETPFGKEWQKETGVTIKMQQPSNNDSMNMIFASGELPDIISYDFGGYSGGASKAIKDKLIAPITDYLDDYAPDYKKAMDSQELYKKSIVTPKGQVPGFNFIRDDDKLLVSQGMMVRKDWLADLGLDVPQTPDEFRNVLERFKKEKGASIPFSVNGTALRTLCGDRGMMTTPFGLPNTDYYMKDGKIHYGAAEANYKKYLEYLHGLFKDGLLDPNFAALDQTKQNSNIMNGDAGVTEGALCGGLGNYLQTMKSSDPNYDLVAMKSLVTKDGDKAMYSAEDNPVQTRMFVITPACKNKEAAVEFLNYGYTKAGHLLFNFGVEGKSYEMKNGVPTFTDLIMKNPDGLTQQMALAQYTRSWSSDGFVQDVGYINQYASMPQQQDASNKWMDSDVKQYKIPPLTISEKNLSKYAKYTSDLNTYVSEMFTKYVSGTESLDKFDSVYLKTLKDLGVDKVIQMKQEALDEFNSRKV